MKILRIFLRDIKAALRDFMCVWIIIVPVVLALIINFGTPGAADTPARLAVLDGGNAELTAFLDKYAKTEAFPDISAIERRVLERDDVIGIVPGGASGYILIAQGSEPAYITDAANMILSYWEQGADTAAADSLAAFHSFGRTNPALMIIFGAALLVMVTILSGMIIAVGIVEEKADKTIRAMRAAPVSMTGFIIGKSIIGIANTVIIGFICIIAAGFSGIDYAQALLILIAVSFLSFLVGFAAGLSSEDFISAVATLKLVIVPFVGSVLAVELLSETWQRLFYWSPFYFAYDGIKSVLSQTARWDTVLINAGLTAALTLVIYIIAFPKLRKQLT